jgi:hypothetical protein
MSVLFLFLDGVGLGSDDTSVNPFALAHMPNLMNVLDGKRLVLSSLQDSTDNSAASSAAYRATDSANHGFVYHPLAPERATLLALDAGLGVRGLPQSATGQATLLTGINVPAALGYHYGPKPNRAVAEFLTNGNLFCTLQNEGRKSTLLNAYPPGYFASIDSGRRLYSAVPLAVTSAGIPLKTANDLVNGQALSADFSGQGWRDRLNLPDTPLLTPYQAGERLAYLAEQYDLAFFEYWLSDYAGHQQDMAAACSLLESFDQVLGGLVSTWDDQKGLILITSDHGNLEDLSTRRHTENPVPALLIGSPDQRRDFSYSLTDLTGVTPAIMRILGAGL